MMDTDVDADAAYPSEQLEPGSRVGRYLLLEHLGSGGMGLVFLAYDPELDRKVAIKVLRPDRRMGPLRGARLLREAQAMARLAHPNVVAIHDVGLWNEQVFVTMEYVPGSTLTTWLTTPRSPAQIVAVFLDAGRGLAAAHAAGLIHRDFKPDNVLVGQDGRARVMDFGLVRAYADTDDALDHDLDEPDPDDNAAHEPSAQRGFDRGATSPLTSPLTRLGVLIGTPPYMAPEQFSGARVDARTDQFAFCIALFEALWGQRPFAAEDRMHDVMHGIRKPRPTGRRVPQWLDDIVERGLAHDPADRWPSMDALLATLAVDPSVGRRRRVVAIAVLGLSGLLTTGLWAFGQHRHKQDVATCDAERDSVKQIWNLERSSTLEARFTETDDPAGASSWKKTRLWLDAYADELGRSRHDNCMAQRVEHTRVEADAAIVDACLDDHQAQLEALIDVLVEARPGMIQNGASAASSLPLLASCMDTRRQAAVLRPPAEIRDPLRRSTQQLYRSEALRVIGELDEAREVAEAALVSAQALDWKPAVAGAQLALARLQYEAGEKQDAERLATLAFRKAAVAGDSILMFDAALIVGRCANVRGDHAQAEAWIETSMELLAGGGLESSMQAARLALDQSAVARTRGRLVDARAHAERGLELYEAILGPDHPLLDAPLHGLAAVLRELDELKLAEAVTKRELDIVARAYGPDNIRLITVYNGFGASLHLAHDFAGARDYYMRGLAITERVFGPEHPDLVAPLLNLGLIAYEHTGELEQARVYFERSLRIHTAASGENESSIKLLVNLGNTASRQGQHEQALAYLERCVAILEGIQQDPFDLRESFVRASLADAHVRMGNLDAAYVLYERVVAVVVALAGPDDRKLARPLLGLAGIDIARGDLDAAEAKLVKAAAVIDDEIEPERRWALEFRQGQLLSARGQHQQAVAQLRALRDREAGPESTWPYAAGEIDAWLASHASGER
jgi:serine/threonine protein kinase/tetratricopeptide (TPR) repeat protein